MRLDNQDGVSLTTETSDVNQNASLYQGWLDVADAEERVMRNLPRVVASLPAIKREDEPKRKATRADKIAFLRVASSYTATFLLGGVCVAFGARFLGSPSETRVDVPTETQVAETTTEDSGLSLDSLAFESPQEPTRVDVPQVRVSEPSNESPLRFNDVYNSYADGTTIKSNALAPQNDVSNESSHGFQQAPLEEESFPTWADLETNENALPATSVEPVNDDYSLATNSVPSNPTPSPYETAPSSEPFQRNYASAPVVAPQQSTYDANYAQNPNSSLQLSAPSASQQSTYDANYAQNPNSSLQLNAPSATQYALNDGNNSYAPNAQNNGYNGNVIKNSSVNERVYATNAGNTSYNNERELDDFTTLDATNEGFGSYNMSPNVGADVASDVPVFDERRTDAYGTSRNDFATSANAPGASEPGVDRSFIPTFSAPNPTPTQGTPSASSPEYVAQSREAAPGATPVVSSGRPLRW